MPTITSPSAIAIKRAITDLIAGSGLLPIPTATLTAPASAGADSITITPSLDSQNRSRFVRGGKLSILDGLRDSALPILDVSADGGTLTFSPSALGVAGLLDDHTAGTTVYTNLVPFAPFSIAPMLTLGDPVVFVSSQGWRSRQDGFGFTFPVHSVQLQCHFLYNTPDGSGIDPDVWQDQREDAMVTTLKTIEDYLLIHQELATPYATAIAERFGVIGASSDMSRTELQWRPVQQDTWQLIGLQLYTITASAGTTAG